MLEAVAPNGDAVLVREWPRRTKGDDDLVDIWKHELRQLHRLGGYPGAQQYIARLVDAERDDKGFYIVLDAGQRRPLQILLDRGRAVADWLRALHLPANRHRLWRNLQRVARGLEILHNEGLVHRNLDGWAVLTSAGDEPDFQLTGFEWSLRLTSTSDKPDRGRGPVFPSVSFASDWAAFAKLAATVFNITDARVIDLSIPDYDVHESASAQEVRLLRDLMLPTHRVQFDGELVSGRIDQLLEALDAARSSDEGRYHLALRLARDSGLSEAVRDASGLLIESDDASGQLAWIEADLGQSLRLIAVAEDDRTLLYLHGRELVYRLKQYRNDDEPTWQFAFCESAEPATTWSRRAAGATDLPSTAVRFLPHGAARATYQRVRGRTPSWSRQIETLMRPVVASATRETRLHRALTLLHGLEIAFAASSAFAVSVHGASAETVELEYAASPEAEELSEALGLEPPLRRLRDLLDLEKTEGEGWVLCESARLGQAQAGDIELTYNSMVAGLAGNRFSFRQNAANPVLIDQGFLVPAGSRGDFIQFRRQSKAIKALKEHAELLQVMVDPRRRLIATHDDVKEDNGYAELDSAKQSALKELMGLLPIYLLQGPPGVGKTYLVKEVIRRQFETGQASRMLITAQGNHAVDHLLDELSDTWKKKPHEAPFAVRCRPKDDKTVAGPYDLAFQTAAFAAKLSQTSLAGSATPALAAQLNALTGALTGASAFAAGERRSLEGLVMRAANLVFATTNSADLERLVEERGQFDWTVIEEAGKATGCELVTPMMLSHRRLMIGDHKQLPPFGAAEFEALLSDETAVRRTLKVLPRSIHNAVRNLLDEDLLEFIEDDTQDLVGLCTEAKRAFFMFETAIEAELERKKSRPGGRSIASTLSVQHRMHPDICELVSNTFYGGGLVTSAKREIEARSQEKAFNSKDTSRLPNGPVVIVDMPYERSGSRRGRIEREPRFTNEIEIAKVVELIAQLSVTQDLPKTPSLVVLTPYMRQVRRLKDAILNDPQASAALVAFRPVARGSEWCSTVDAFQGNEADVVIFSLVRNNRGATIRKALGFMGDRRRFNVAISRARQKFIFVGSLEFLRTIARPLGLEDDPSADFLREFLRTVDEQVESGKAAKLTVSSGVAIT